MESNWSQTSWRMDVGIPTSRRRLLTWDDIDMEPSIRGTEEDSFLRWAAGGLHSWLGLLLLLLLLL